MDHRGRAVRGVSLDEEPALAESLQGIILMGCNFDALTDLEKLAQ